MKFDAQGHILVSPSEFQQLAFRNPDALINDLLLPGTPMAFLTYASYCHFTSYLAEKTGIHPHQFLFRGSTKIGYSISPNRDKKKTWRTFGPGSDLDLAITDPHFFAIVDEAVRRHDRLPQNREQVFRYRNSREFEQYENRVLQKGKHDCYRFFDLPRGLPCLMELDDVLRNAPIADCCVYPFVDFKAFIFRDRWAVHRRYHTDLDDLRRGLTTQNDPLPPAPEQPYPAAVFE